LSVVIGVLTNIAQLLQFISVQTDDLPAIALPWPVEWLPVWPVLGALVIGVSTAGFFLTIKFTRWVYGMTPFVQ
jgi:hypothetical protein